MWTNPFTLFCFLLPYPYNWHKKQCRMEGGWGEMEATSHTQLRQNLVHINFTTYRK